MTRLANQHGAVNLSQGFPDFPAPEALKAAACDAILADINQYAITWGAKPLRDAIAAGLHAPLRHADRSGREADRVLRIDRGDDVDDAGASSIRATRSSSSSRSTRTTGPTRSCPARRRGSCALPRASDWSFDPDELAAAFNNKTRAIIINTPNNPTGKVFTRAELDDDRRGSARSGTSIAVTDEIYEHIVYDGAEHVPMATLDGMAERTVDDQQRVEDVQRDRLARGLDDRAAGDHERDPQGARLPDGRRGGAAPGGRGRRAAAAARRTTRTSRRRYRAKRERLMRHSQQAGLRLLRAEGRVLHHDGHLRRSVSRTTSTFARYLVTEIGVASVPGSSFYPQGSGSAARRCVSASARKRRRSPRRSGGSAKLARTSALP